MTWKNVEDGIALCVAVSFVFLLVAVARSLFVGGSNEPEETDPASPEGRSTDDHAGTLHNLDVNYREL